MKHTILFQFAWATSAAFVASGCAGVAWEKQGADEHVVSRDLQDCRSAAEVSSFRFGFGPFNTTPNVIITPAGPATTFQTPAATAYPDPVLVQDFTSDCMRKKGYELVRRD